MATKETKNWPNYTMGSKLHVVMFPWLAYGHFIPYLHLSNKLAERGHKVSYLLPKGVLPKLQRLNQHPHLIKFFPLLIPHVHGLPPGVETASDIPFSLSEDLATAFDRTQDQVEAILTTVKPDIVFFDFAHWVPRITKSMGIKTINYQVFCAAAIAICLVQACAVHNDDDDGNPIKEVSIPPEGYPSTTVVLRGRRESEAFSFVRMLSAEETTFFERVTTAMKECDMISIRTCHEIEGKFCDYIGMQYNKPVCLTGLVLPQPASMTTLEEKWVNWLSEFKPGSVIFCAFGTQITLEKEQFQEVLLGIELTNLPFIIALKPPTGASTVEEAMLEGFEERTKGRGVVYSGWVQQPLILSHLSVGCFVSHCGFGSTWESLMSDCQIVLVPHLGDQILSTRLMADELKVAVEVEIEENGWFSKESLCKAIKCVMDEDSQVGHMVKKSHAKWKQTLVTATSGYIDKFEEKMQAIVI